MLYLGKPIHILYQLTAKNHSQHSNFLWNKKQATIPFSISSNKPLTKMTIAIKHTPSSLYSMLCQRQGLNTWLTFAFDWIPTMLRALHGARNRSRRLYFCPSAFSQSGWQVGDGWTKPVGMWTHTYKCRNAVTIYTLCSVTQRWSSRGSGNDSRKSPSQTRNKNLGEGERPDSERSRFQSTSLKMVPESPQG